MRRSDDQMAKISEACNEMVNSKSLSEFTRADTRFHVCILMATGNDLLVPLGVLIESALVNLFVQITRQENRLDYAKKLHQNIEKNIRLQKPEAARAAVRKLLADTDQIIASQVRD